MSSEIRVTNQPPDQTGVTAHLRPMLEIFQGYVGSRDRPYTHQAQVWEQHSRGKSTYVVAGTASGKTLAEAVPLFYKLFRAAEGERIRRALWMYPTIALLEDQQRVLADLALAMGLDPGRIIGRLQGGMSRVELIAALNKPVLLATPDEVYWFFRKNVKYSGLLIYGLALVDEFVLDEAHLFSGLALHNLSHLKYRIQFLSERLGRHPRWHVLTATPTPELRKLTEGEEVRGRSRCGDVVVTFLEPATGYDERRNKLINAAESALAEGAHKVLVVFNSADLAHRVFEGLPGNSRPDLPSDLKLRFGRVRWGNFNVWLRREGIEGETVDEIERSLEREGPLYLKDLADDNHVVVPTETLIAKVTRLLEAQVWILKRLTNAAARENGQDLIEAVGDGLTGGGRLARLMWSVIRPYLRGRVGADSVERTLDKRASEMQSALERIWAEDSLTLTAPAFAEITTSLHQAGMSPELANMVMDYLKYTVEIPEMATIGLQLSPQELSRRHLTLSWLEWIVTDYSRRNGLITRIRQALEERRFEVETPHIAVWGETGVPVVIYTGRMSKTDRKGLIEAFAALPKAVLVSTPAVEVGVDFVADTLITEQCDGNGFLQRFGRVGRRSGMQGKVVVLVKDGETYVRLRERYRPQMGRDEFSALIADAHSGIFPARLYAEGSAFLDATHWLINAQLGDVGHWLNQQMFGEGEASELAAEFRAGGLPFAYGLRGTLPEVALRGGTSGGEPFYALRKVANDRLLSSDSPFEFARADMGYLEFLWKKSLWKIAVNAGATLESSQAIFWWQGGRWHLRAGRGIAADYARLFHPAIRSNLQALEPKAREDLAGLLERLRPHDDTNAKVRAILRVGEALPLFFAPHARFILGQGDLHLTRLSHEGIPEEVEDRIGNPLVLSDQLWLILYNYTREQAENLLTAASALGLEEVIYDWHTLELQGSQVIGPVLVDRAAGACFDVYRRLVSRVGG